MAGAVYMLKIERGKIYRLAVRGAQPVDHRIHPRLKRHGIIKNFPVSGMHLLDIGLRTYPEHRSRPDSLLFQGIPDGLAAIPPSVFHRLTVADAIPGIPLGI